ncbi:hypothetical protein WJX84_004461 [Apatococcus fuscideae]|uniref:Uncharacterized protein n=1 Tax=Apatococcus fuscideae TaxID=2026836 RepID=A0AAW1TC23_9CHLO
MFLWIAAVLVVLAGLLGLVWVGGRLQRKNTDALLKKATTMRNVAAHAVALKEQGRQPESPGAQVVDTSATSALAPVPARSAADDRPAVPDHQGLPESSLQSSRAGLEKQPVPPNKSNSEAALSQARQPATQEGGQPVPKPGSLKHQMQHQAAGFAQAVQSVFKPLRGNSEEMPPATEPQPAIPEPAHDTLHELQMQQDLTRRDIGALKRLQRETFQRLLGLDRAVDLLQPKPEPPVAAAAREAERGVQGSREQADAHLADAGVGGPPALTARLHSALQDGRGRLVAFLRIPSTSILSDAGVLNASLDKVSCSWRATSSLQLRLLGLGCSAADAAPSLNPLEGKGVTNLMRQGCHAHQLLQGTGLGASCERGRWLLSAAHVLPGEEKRRAGSLLQANVSVTPDISLGLTGINRPRQHPLAAAATCYDSLQYLGFLRGPKHRAGDHRGQPHSRSDSAAQAGHPSGTHTPTLAAPLPTPAADPHRQPAAPEPHPQPPTGTSRSCQSISGACRDLALTGAVGLGDEAVLAGWIGTGVAGPGTKMGWGLTASLYPDLDGSTAAIAIGRHPGALSRNAAGDVSPLVMEASFQRPLAEGITLSPAFACVRAPRQTSLVTGFRLEALF